MLHCGRIQGNFARRELENSKSFCEAPWSRLRTQGTAIVGLSENREDQSCLYASAMQHTLTTLHMSSPPTNTL